MVKFLGSADVPGIVLKYFVFGTRRSGYSIRILNRDGECANQFVSQNLEEVLSLGDKLKHGAVFPQNLSEILEDLQYEGAQKPC